MTHDLVPLPAATPATSSPADAPDVAPATGDQPTEDGVAAFLAALAETGMVKEAITRTGVPRATLYRRRSSDAAFATQWAEALALGLDQLRDEGVRRALHGVERPVFHAGKLVGTVRHYSDALLMFLLRSHQPEVYREPRRGELSASQATEEELARAFEEGGSAALGEILARIDGRTRYIWQTGDPEVDAIKARELGLDPETLQPLKPLR
jgi:hypothetical protein